MTTPNVPSGVLAIRVRGGPRIVRLSICTATEQITLRGRDKQVGRNTRGQNVTFARHVHFEEPKSADEASTDAEEEQASGVPAVDPVHTCVRPQVIHLSSELSEYLRPTDKLRAKVDSNLTMAISLDDPSLRIVHEIRGGWFGLALFMFGWANASQEYATVYPSPLHRMEPVRNLDVDPPSWSREDSAFLRNYPWDDTVLLAGPAHSLEKHFPPQQSDGDVVNPVLRSHRGHNHGAVGAEAQTIEHFLQAHERMIQQLILSTAANTELMECPESSAILQSHRITKGTQASNVLCRYIALLRVFDVASTLEGRQRGARIAKWHGWEPAENPDFKALSHLSDVQSLLLKAKQALNTFAAPSDDANRTEESLTTMPLDTPHRIMKELAHSMTKAKGCQIVSNILLASLHLSWLLSGNIDIPDTFSHAIHSVTPAMAREAEMSNGNVDAPEAFRPGALDLAALTEGERAELSNLLSEKDSPSKIRFPLIYSLFISPLFLLPSLSSASSAPSTSVNADVTWTGSLGPRSPLASTPTVEALQEFTMRIQSAAISASIGSSLPHLHWALTLTKRTIQQLISGLPPSTNAAIMPPQAPLTSDGATQALPPASVHSASQSSLPSIPNIDMQQTPATSVTLFPSSSLSSAPPTSNQDVQATTTSPPPSLPPAPSSESRRFNETGSGPSQTLPVEDPNASRTELEDSALNLLDLPAPLELGDLAQAFTPAGSPRPPSRDILDVDMQSTPTSSTLSSPLSSPPSTPSVPDVDLDDIAQAPAPEPESQSNADSSDKGEESRADSPKPKDDPKAPSKPRRKPRSKRARAPPHEEETVESRTASLSSSGNSLDTAIMVDRIMDATRTMGPPEKTKFLSRDQDPKKPKRHPPNMPEQGYTFYGPRGKAFTWEPRFYGADVTLFEDWVSAIQANVCSGKPLHVSDPDKSLFLVMDEVDYNALPVEQRRDVWAKQGKLAIIQTNCQQSQAVQFDNGGMATLTGRIDVPIEVQDQSQPLGPFANISRARSRRTTLQELVELSDIPIEKRPIINALNLPLTPGLRPEQNFPFSSEHVAWLRTLGNSLCFNDYPTSHTRWSLVAFDGALHYAHIDSDGFGTWVEVKHRLETGTDEEPIPSFGDINGVLRAFGVGDKPNSNWDVEAAVLEPGSRLIMAPNTMHAVWTMENSICYGGTSIPLRPCFQPSLGLLLRRWSTSFTTVLFVGAVLTAESADKEHLPNFEDPGMFAGTFALLYLMELQNVLDFRSYIPPNDDISSVWHRISAGSMAFAMLMPFRMKRGWTLELATWVFCHYDILPQTGPHANQPLLDLWVDFYWPNLAHFMVAIDVYKARYPHGITKERGVSIDAFRQQVNYSIDGREELESAREAIDRLSIKSIAPPFAYSIVKREKPHAFLHECFKASTHIHSDCVTFLGDTANELTANGYRGGDRIYIEAYKEALAFQAHRRRAE
ncbi:hypothetical protein BKA70DRAFT_1231783 [Coprinopsis sp. MPI-PUGE-AT-0042]|nr:hypothetical protein BKA70DRAFT_1231783 [Coprinopsis sp. MPI-PUGE-AT-0042]